MVKLSACIEMMWGDVKFPERITKIAGLGYKHYEFWAWWGKDLDAIERATKDAGIAVGACCVNTSFEGDVSLVMPDSAKFMAKAVQDCLPVRDRLGCKTFIATTGNELKDVSREQQHAAVVAALKAGAPVAEAEGITIVLEPLNVLVDHKGYYLATSEEAFQIIREVNSPNVKLLFDIYHQQITEGNVARNIFENLDLIGHFHAANNPGRHELSSGEINYEYLLRRIGESAYKGVVGLEFSPSDPARTDDILRETLAMA